MLIERIAQGPYLDWEGEDGIPEQIIFHQT
jgi:hypothetical protein